MKKVYIVTENVQESVHTYTEILKIFNTLEQAQNYINNTPVEKYPFTDKTWLDIVEKNIEEN